MNFYNIVHKYVCGGKSDVYLATPLDSDAVCAIMAKVHFLAEEIVSDTVMLHEDFQAEIIVKFFSKESTVSTTPPDNFFRIDQYIAREDACCDGVTYKSYIKDKDSELYQEIRKYILDNPQRYDE